MTDRIEDAHLDHDEEGIYLFLEGDFVDTCEDYLNRAALSSAPGRPSPDANTIALRVDRNVLDRISREKARYGF